MYLLDTNICSALIKNNNPKLVEKVLQIDERFLKINWVVASELKFGAYYKQSEKLTNRVNQFLAQFDILMSNETIFDSYAKVRSQLTTQGNLIGANDLWIASHAIAENFIVVTDNTREFC